MKDDAATPDEMLVVVKWWAQARGFLTEPLKDWTNPPEWVVHPMPTHVSIGKFADENAMGGGGWRVSFTFALAWAILVESKPPLVDVGPCPSCEGARHETAVHTTTYTDADGEQFADDHRRDYEARGWFVAVAFVDGEHVVTARRPCPVCSGTGRKLAAVPRLLLDATTDPTARAHLLVAADKMQAADDRLGALIMWALTTWVASSPDLRHSADAVAWLRRQTAKRQAKATRVVELSLGYTSSEVDGELFVEVAGHHYSYSAQRGVTAQQIADAFNAQGGPGAFAVSPTGLTFTMHDVSTSSTLSASFGDRTPPPRLPRERREAPRHIGDRLARRLGVRR